jgi:hypothetical protein
MNIDLNLFTFEYEHIMPYETSNTVALDIRGMLLAGPVSPGRSKTPADANATAPGDASHMPDLEKFKLALSQLPYAQPPEMGAKPKVAQLKEILRPAVTAKSLVPVNGIPRDELDPRFDREKPGLTTNLLTQAYIKPDLETRAQIIQGIAESEPTEEEKEEIIEAFKEANTYVVANPVSSMYKRFVLGMTEDAIVRLREQDVITKVEGIVQYYPCAVPSLVGMGLRDVILHSAFEEWRLNGKANAGAPYWGEKMEKVWQESVALATTVFNAIADGSYANLRKTRPGLFLNQLKNKMDRYPSSKITEKVRPYMNVPSWQKVLYSIVQYMIKPKLFVDGGFSMIGFSWASGGGDQIIHFIEEAHQVAGVAYGDDGLYVVTSDDEKSRWVFTPDVSHMDMSLVSDWKKVALKIFQMGLGTLDATWLEVLKQNCIHAFNKPVLVGESLVYATMKGLASGIPGTSKFDELASAALYYDFRVLRSVRKITSQQDVEMLANEWQLLAQKNYGLRIKPSTLVVFEYVPGANMHPWEILGKRLRKHAGATGIHYIPYTPLDKVLLIPLLPRRGYRSQAERQAAALSRIRAACLEGGFWHPKLLDGLRFAYRWYVARGVLPDTEGLDPEEDIPMLSEQTDVMTGDFNWQARALPRYVEFVNHYLPPDDRIPITNLGEAGELEEGSAMGSVVDWTDLKFDVGDWAEEVETATEQMHRVALELTPRPKADIGRVQLENPPIPADEAKMHLVPPDHKKRRLRAEMLEKREYLKRKREEMLNHGKVPRVGARTSGTGNGLGGELAQMVAEHMFDVDEYDNFPDPLEYAESYTDYDDDPPEYYLYDENDFE